MDSPIALDPSFQIVGAVSFAASLAALGCSIGHSIFYLRQRNRQSDEFMRGLACRMKAIFVIMSCMFSLDLISGYGLMVDYTMGTWLTICVIKAFISVSYVASLFWLYVFYRSPHA